MIFSRYSHPDLDIDLFSTFLFVNITTIVWTFPLDPMYLAYSCNGQPSPANGAFVGCNDIIWIGSVISWVFEFYSRDTGQMFDDYLSETNPKYSKISHLSPALIVLWQKQVDAGAELSIKLVVKFFLLDPYPWASNMMSFPANGPIVDCYEVNLMS